MSQTPTDDDRRTDVNQTESAGWRTEYAAAGADLPDDVPTTDDLANRLGVTTRRLDRFVEFHPNPTVANILGFAVADPSKHREAVAAWLADRRRQREARRTELDSAEIPDDLRTVNSGWYRAGREGNE